MPEPIDAKESDYLYLEESGIPGAGKGLFTSILIYQDEVISLFKGETLTNREASIRAKNNMDGYFINMPDGTIMDSNNVACFAKYANDAGGHTSIKLKNNASISLNNQDAVCLIATRDIRIGEEIFCSYGRAYWKKFQLS